MNALILTVALLGHTEVTPTAILGHGDPTPRFAAHYENVLVVPAGQTVTLPPDSTYDAVEVSGTLRASEDHDAVCRTIHLTVMPGGTLDLDTPKRCEIIFRDVPLRTGTVQQPDIDPHQIGNGLIVFGTLRIHGHQLDSPFTQLTAEAQAGATTIQFDVPGGWQVGDELLLPDSRQIVSTGQSLVPIRRESPVTIAAISGNVVTLSKPLDFEHLAARNPDGGIEFMPYVANLTRNVVLRSENPTGTKGHCIFLEQAKVDCQYFEVRDMGRTRAEPLHSTSLTGSATDQIGTNQIARYAWHWHHVHGHADIDGFTGRTVGAVLRGGEKWGCVQHGTHDLRIADNIAIDQIGSGFVTEDGYEVRGQYLRNFAAYIKGVPGDGKSVMLANNPGAEGVGFWFHSMCDMTIEGNVAACCNIGYSPFYRQQVKGRMVPSVPGGENDTPIDPTKGVPLSFRDNVACCNKSHGYEPWNNDYAPFKVYNFTSWHNGQWQVKAGTDEPGAIDFVNLRALAVPGKGASGVSTSSAYIARVELEGGWIKGCDVGAKEAKRATNFRNVEWQNIVDIDWGDFRPERGRIESPLFKSLPGKVAAVKMGQGFAWKHGDPMPDWKLVTAWGPNDGTRYVATDWNRTGQDYLLFENYQRASNDALPAKGYNGLYCPQEGLSNQECWDKYGVACGGGIIKDADAIELPGLINGVAKAGLDYYPLPPSRAVLQQPNMLEPFNPASTDRLHLTITGEQVPGVVVVSQTNDLPVNRHKPDQYDPPGFSRIARMTTPGTHTVKTWLEDASGAKVPGSDGVFRYFVGEPSEPPVEPPPPPTEPTIDELKSQLAACKAAGLTKDARIAELEAKISAAKAALE